MVDSDASASTIVAAAACSLHFLLIALLSIFSCSQFAVKFPYQILPTIYVIVLFVLSNHLAELFAEQILLSPPVTAEWSEGFWRLFIAPDNLKVE